MINVWWVTRPKRRLDSIPEILALLADENIGKEWSGQRNTHLSVESALEKKGLKRVGDRRDQGGSGARTYLAWLKSYGLVFEYNDRLEFTLAGEAILAGKSPVEVMKNQILKFQYPSPFSISPTIKTRLTDRFEIRPFRFLLRLLSEPLLDYYLTEDEVGYIVIEEAENESESCYKKVVNHILDYRDRGALSLPSLEQFNILYGESQPHKWTYYTDIANTLFNVIEYTQLARRTDSDGFTKLVIPEDSKHEVNSILSNTPSFISRPEDEVYFQRKYGVGPFQQKDTRNLDNTKTVTPKIIMESKIRTAFISKSLTEPIYKISSDLIDSIVVATNNLYSYSEVEDTLRKMYPHGAIGGFFSNYYQMAFSGRDEARDFEIATANIFKEVFGFESKQIGQTGRVPDVVISSESDKYQVIIDNKAYEKYTVQHDHYNRMVYTYIPKINEYSFSKYPLVAFCYIAGGFGPSMSKSLLEISDASGIKGSALTVSTVIKLAEGAQENGNLTHEYFKNILSSNRVMTPSDVIA